MKRSLNFALILLAALLLSGYQSPVESPRHTIDFTGNWRFHLGAVSNAQMPDFDDSSWRTLDLPHDWSIEGEFSPDNPAGVGGGALPGGIGWYRKTFRMDQADAEKLVFIDFDGVYQKSEVWINGHYLGIRPYGYSSFRYELTPYLHYGNQDNILAVKVDNSEQPNSRWYSGSGIYRNVRLVTTGKVYVDHWGTFVTTPAVSREQAKVAVETMVRNTRSGEQNITLHTTIYDPSGKAVASVSSDRNLPGGSIQRFEQETEVTTPALWSVKSPVLYQAVSTVESKGEVLDTYRTTFGIRTFTFDSEKGFILNGTPVKIKGVCLHHDLGSLGAAVHPRALERQLEILKSMGCNGIRTSHNPPAPELLELADRMGFVVMDEAFDVWKARKTRYDYHLYWDDWHERDLRDMVLRDRNHPSVVLWSIGNEVREQGDSSGAAIALELSGNVKSLDTTRPVTAGCNHADPSNSLIWSGAIDVIGYNYHEGLYADIPQTYPGKPFIATETTSALATRGHYDMPSDSVHIWPIWRNRQGSMNADFTCSAYDNCRVPWGSTHEDAWRVTKQHDFVAGMFIWTGFDYLGEPTPYRWPARSSYFGIVDLAGFPKDAFYLYQSEWTDRPVLQVFPHWNWEEGQTVDVWAYTNCDEVELFLNGESMGTRRKTGGALHLMWRLTYHPGTLRAVGRTNGEVVLTREIKTAGDPAAIQLSADRETISADGKDLVFVTATIVDEDGNMVPRADNLMQFQVQGPGSLIAVDNGSPISHASFQASNRKALSGKCLAIIQAGDTSGDIAVVATSEGLSQGSVHVRSAK